MGIEPFLVASAIELVIAQRLVRRLCPECTKEKPSPRCKLRGVAGDLRYRPGRGGAHPRASRAGGLRRRCRGTGYRGRIGLFEIFRLNDELHELILKRESTRTLTVSARKHGMRTLGQDAAGTR